MEFCWSDVGVLCELPVRRDHDDGCSPSQTNLLSLLLLDCTINVLSLPRFCNNICPRADGYLVQPEGDSRSRPVTLLTPHSTSYHHHSSQPTHGSPGNPYLNHRTSMSFPPNFPECMLNVSAREEWEEAVRVLERAFEVNLNWWYPRICDHGEQKVHRLQLHAPSELI